MEMELGVELELGNKRPPKRKKGGFGPRADTKITWATTPPTNTFQA